MNKTMMDVYKMKPDDLKITFVIQGKRTAHFHSYGSTNLVDETVGECVDFYGKKQDVMLYLYDDCGTSCLHIVKMDY